MHVKSGGSGSTVGAAVPTCSSPVRNFSNYFFPNRVDREEDTGQDEGQWTQVVRGRRGKHPRKIVLP
jgi:hypothetical protein